MLNTNINKGEVGNAEENAGRWQLLKTKIEGTGKFLYVYFGSKGSNERTLSCNVNIGISRVINIKSQLYYIERLIPMDLDGLDVWCPFPQRESFQREIGLEGATLIKLVTVDITRKRLVSDIRLVDIFFCILETKAF